MKAINNYVIVNKIKTEPKMLAGLIMTDSTDVDNRYLRGTIISAGNVIAKIPVVLSINDLFESLARH